MKILTTVWCAMGLAFAAPVALSADAPPAAGPPATASPAAAEPQCAAAADAARVVAAYSSGPAPLTYQAAAQLKLSEAVIASAIPTEKAVGTTGAGFVSIWESLSHWDGALFLIMKDGSILEITSAVSTGTPSTKSKFFNLGHEGAVSGHLRPDLISSIYALQLPAREGFTRGVMFYDGKGENVFGVFVGGEGKEPSAAQLAQFKATWDLIAGMPRVCAAAR
jgi:putative heme utilization carrier protein HutX